MLIAPFLSAFLLTTPVALPVEEPAGVAELTAPQLPEGYERLGAPAVLGSVRSGSLLLVTDRPGIYLPAPSLDTEVEIRVTGLVVRTRVVQSFENPTSFWVEGVYAFPLPETSAVDTLEMQIGDRRIVGRVEEREEARRVYEDAKREGRRTSLLEQERPNLFTTSVANLGPGETVRVLIEYQHELAYRDGRYSLRFPMVVAPRYIPGRAVGSSEQTAGPGWSVSTDAVADAPRITPPVLAPPSIAGAERPILNPVSLEVAIESTVELSRLASPSHELEVDSSGAFTRITPRVGAVPADRDFVLSWSTPVGDQPRAVVMRETRPDGTWLQLLLVPPPAEAIEEALPREVVFILDVSGSMAGTSIDQAKAALLLALERLGPRDRFNVVAFATDFAALFPHSGPADYERLERARRWVDGLDADGGTEMLPALTWALGSLGTSEQSVRQIVFVTDGAVGNEDQLFSAIETGLGKARLFTVGIGSAPNAHFMRRAARFGRGSFTYVDASEGVEQTMGDLFRRLETPALSDIEVEWGEREVEPWPPRIPDLYAGEPLALVARVSSAEGVIRVSGRRAGGRWSTALDLEEASQGEASGIEKLWARRWIEALMDGAVRGRPEEDVRSEVVAVALRHGLVSKYTSLVAVDLTPARPESEAVHPRALPVHLPAGWEYEKVFGTLPQGGTAWRGTVLLGALLLLAWVLWSRLASGAA